MSKYRPNNKRHRRRGVCECRNCRAYRRIIKNIDNNIATPHPCAVLQVHLRVTIGDCSEGYVWDSAEDINEDQFADIAKQLLRETVASSKGVKK